MTLKNFKKKNKILKVVRGKKGILYRRMRQ